MSVEQVVSYEEQSELDTQHHLGLLVRELCSFANNNPRFKKGAKDYVAIKVTEGDYILPKTAEDQLAMPNDHRNDGDELTDDYDEDDFPIPVDEYTYSFEAERKRYITDSGEERAWVLFMFSVVGRQANALLPQHIAENVMGLPPEEARREAGTVTHQTEHLFTLSTRERTLTVCESSAYLDLDEDPISEACSCASKDMFYITDDDIIEEADVAMIDADSIQQYAPADVKERSMHEVVIQDDLEVAVDEWRAAQEAGLIIDTSIRHSTVTRARVVMKIIQEAIQEQAGVRSPN